MTKNANLKNRVRARAARTGESYAAARSHLAPPDEPRPRSARIAVAQTVLRPDPRSRAQLRASGADVRRLMGEAALAAADVVLFPDGALTSPGKRVVSSRSDAVAEADWSTVDRAAIEEELTVVGRLAGELGLCTVVGGIVFDGDETRPFNSLFVFSRSGRLVGRYDERLLSNTKASFMYRRGMRPFVFRAAGMLFGCALGMEAQYPEVFAAYERTDVDAVLFATTGNPEHADVFALESAGHAAANSYWVAYAGSAEAGQPPSGVIPPSGAWAARCAGGASIAVAEIDTAAGSLARVWRRSVRAELDGML